MATTGEWKAVERTTDRPCASNTTAFPRGNRRNTFGDLAPALRLDQPPSTRPVQFPDVDREVIRANATDLLPQPVIPASPQTQPVHTPGTKPQVP